jgi:hypothetical protein
MGGKKAGGGFMGVGGQSGFLNTGLFSSGPQKVKGFEMNPMLNKYENEMLARQSGIASGQIPTAATQEAQNAAQSTAASARGLANPALAARAASQQVTQEGLAAAMRERQMADQMIAQQAAAQRGVAFNQATTNLNSTLQNQQNQLGAISGIGQSMAMAGSGGKGGTSSDENMKKDIKPGNAAKDLEAFVGALKSYDFKYKDPSKPGASKGKQSGVMAQDLEESDIGKQAVMDTENGKMVDYNKLMPAMLASIVELNKKLKKG